jgi:hypothetical protein
MVRGLVFGRVFGHLYHCTVDQASDGRLKPCYYIKNAALIVKAAFFMTVFIYWCLLFIA